MVCQKKKKKKKKTTKERTEGRKSAEVENIPAETVQTGVDGVWRDGVGRGDHD